jgi:hypothetical protein
MLFYGFAGGIRWPFFSWHLYAIEINEELDYYELRIADSLNHEIKYDARAVSPTLTTPVRRLAGKMPSMNDKKLEELGQFLFYNACVYRKTVEKAEFNFGKWIKFPPHQFGYKWKKENLAKLGPFKYIRVYRVKTLIDEKGRAVLDYQGRAFIKYEF